MTEKHIYLFASCPSVNSQVQVIEGLVVPRHHYASRNIKLQTAWSIINLKLSQSLQYNLHS